VGDYSPTNLLLEAIKNMDDSIIANPEEIILVKINKIRGFYAYIIDVINDIKPGWWQVKMCPFIPASDFKLSEITWKLDDQQIRGSEFTMNGVVHQLCKVDLPKNINNNSKENSNESSNNNISIPKQFKNKKEIPSYLKPVK